MNKCKQCKYYMIKGKPWFSVEPHPCTGCIHAFEPQDNFVPLQEATQ